LLLVLLALLIAAVGGMIAVGFWLLAVIAFHRLLEPRAIRLVRRYLQEHRPGEPPAQLILAATEPSRWVVCAAFGARIPLAFEDCFAVARTSGEITQLSDCSAYLPNRSGAR
jgi:hypothetical protein